MVVLMVPLNHPLKQDFPVFLPSSYWGSAMETTSWAASCCIQDAPNSQHGGLGSALVECLEPPLRKIHVTVEII